MESTAEDTTDKPSGLARFRPVLDWGRRYDRSWLRGDLVAGLAVAALVVVLVIGGLAASIAFDFEDRDIALVGDVPRGFVAPRVPDLDFVASNFATIGPAALGLLPIGFSQTAGDARAFASKHGYRIDIDPDRARASRRRLARRRIMTPRIGSS